MRIHGRPQAPGRVTGPTAPRTGPLPVGPKSASGLGAQPAAPPARSTAGVLARVLGETLGGKTGAWTDVAQAVAGATGGPTAAGVTGASRGPLDGLAAGARKAVVDTIGALREGDTGGALRAFGDAAKGLGEETVTGVVQHVVRQTYAESLGGLRNLAGKLKHLNEQKTRVREQLGSVGATGAAGRLHEQLQELGDDAQLAQADLQNALQHQQQTMQMMSNLSKQLSDTAMEVIRKLGG